MTLLIDAPRDYGESPDPEGGGLYCDSCPTLRDVTKEPCPEHGPAATVDRRIDYPRLADLAELVMRGRACDGDEFLANVRHQRLNVAHLPLLEEWGVLGRTSRNVRVVAIHEAHVDTVRTVITERRGDPRHSGGALAYLAMPPLPARFRQIVELTAEGTKTAAIGRLMHLSTETIKTYTAQIRRELRAVDRTHMVHIAHQRGLFGAIPQQPGGQR